MYNFTSNSVARITDILSISIFCFQFSTADLVEATAALQPLSIEGALTGVDQFGNITTSSTVSGITVQDGMLTS